MIIGFLIFHLYTRGTNKNPKTQVSNKLQSSILSSLFKKAQLWTRLNPVINVLLLTGCSVNIFCSSALDSSL